MIGYISIFLAMAVLVVLIWKNWSPLVVALIASAVVIFMNGLPYGATMTDTFYGGFCSMFQTLFPMIFSGSLMATMYIRSGAVLVVADTISDVIFREKSSATARYVTAIIAIVVTSGFISYCGISSAVVLIAVYPIAIRIMERAGIPKKFVMGIITGGVYTFALTGPGSTEVANVLAMNILGTPATAGLVGGCVAILTEVIIMTVILTIMIKKSVARGEKFAYGPKDQVAWHDGKKPGFIISLIPLLAVIILFNVTDMGIFPATIIGWVLSVVLFGRFLQDGKKGIMESFVDGGKMSFIPTSTIASIVGFSAVVQSLPEFQNILNAVFSLKASPVVILICSVSFIAAMTGSSSSGIRVALPLVYEELNARGLALAFIHRVGCFSCSIIDSMPWSGAVVMSMSIADLDVKEGYPPVFISTTVATFCGTIICALFMSIFPNLP